MTSRLTITDATGLTVEVDAYDVEVIKNLTPPLYVRGESADGGVRWVDTGECYDLVPETISPAMLRAMLGPVPWDGTPRNRAERRAAAKSRRRRQ